MFCRGGTAWRSVRGALCVLHEEGKANPRRGAGIGANCSARVAFGVFQKEGGCAAEGFVRETGSRRRSIRFYPHKFALMLLFRFMKK